MRSSIIVFVVAILFLEGCNPTSLQTYPSNTQVLKTMLSITPINNLIKTFTQARISENTSKLTPTPDRENLNFEYSIGWTFNTNGEFWNGQYSNVWSTSGRRSYRIQVPGDHMCSYFPGKNTFGEVSQKMSLSGYSQLLLDMYAFSGWDHPDVGNEYYISFEILIDDVIVSTKERQNGYFMDYPINITNYNGLHKLGIRVRMHANYCTTSTEGFGLYIDHIRLLNYTN